MNAGNYFICGEGWLVRTGSKPSSLQVEPSDRTREKEGSPVAARERGVCKRDALPIKSEGAAASPRSME